MDVKARDYIQYFFKKHFPDNEGMIYPIEPVEIITDYKIAYCLIKSSANDAASQTPLINPYPSHNAYNPRLFRIGSAKPLSHYAPFFNRNS